MINLITTDVNHLYVAFVIISAIVLFILRKAHYKKPVKGKLYHGMNFGLLMHGLCMYFFVYQETAHIDFWSNEKYFILGRILYSVCFAWYLYNVLDALCIAMGNVKAKARYPRYLNITWGTVIFPVAVWLANSKIIGENVLVSSGLILLLFAAPLIQMAIVFYALKWRAGIQYNALLIVGGGGVLYWISFHYEKLLEPRGGYVYFWTAFIGVLLVLMFTRKNLIMDRVVKYLHRKCTHTDGCM